MKKEKEELKAKLAGNVEVELASEEPTIDPISFNPENVQKIENIKLASKRERSIMDSILEKINK